MPSKRQQRELEELEALKANQLPEAADNDVYAPKSVPTFAQVWSQLSRESEQESDHGGGSESHKKKKKKKKKKATPATPGPSTPSRDLADRSPPTTTTKSEKKKALKKQKEKEKKSGTTMDELDQALAELSIKYPDIQTQSSSSSSTTATAFNPKLLAVSLSHLDSEAELRKFFGSKVVQANQAPSSSSSHGNRRGRQAIPIRSHLTKPKSTWWAAKQREGLSIRAYTNQEVAEKAKRCGWEGALDEKWWTVDCSRKYKSMTKAFIRTVLSGDPQGFWDLIGLIPWHADTLLQLAEIYRHREEWAQAVDFVDRALFTYERSFIGAFDFTSGQNRLDFDLVENRPFFLAVHRQITDLQRRGCVRTAFEFSRLLYSLDPWSDPHGALLHLDFLALKAQGMNQWLLDVYDNFSSRRKNRPPNDTRADPSVLPGWAYSRALAMWMVEDARKDKDHKASSEALKEAVLSFPSVVPLLADKIEAHIPGTIRAHIDFKVQVDGAYMSPSDSMLHMLSHLYAQHAFGIWKEPAHAEWFTSVVTSLALPSSHLPITPQRQEFMRLYDQSENLRYSAYRHITVQESSYRRLFSFIPKQVTESRSLACDPLPPPSAVSRYDAEFFDGVEDAFESGMFGATRTRRRQQRGAGQNPLLQQVQEIFNANPQIAERFPGGMLQFADMIDQIPPDVLEDMLVQLDAAGLEAQQHGGMPGNFDEGAVDGPGVAIRQAADQVEPDGEGNTEEEEEEEEEEEASPALIRGLRNFIGHFWRRGNTLDGDPDSDDDDGDDETGPVDGMGVD